MRFREMDYYEKEQAKAAKVLELAGNAIEKMEEGVRISEDAILEYDTLLAIMEEAAEELHRVKNLMVAEEGAGNE